MTEPTAATIICGNTDCKVAETGKCVEGLALERCPHYGRSSVGPESLNAAADNVGTVLGVALPAGDLLNTVAAGSILRNHDTRVVAIIGPKGAGKTTLIASLYDLFQVGPVNATRFARSHTMMALERACHHSRAVSLRDVPATERTILKDVHFYHIGIRVGTGPILDLLLADRAGEEYREATDDVSAARAFPEITRADVITLLVDGARLIDLKSRQSVHSEIVMILRALIDGEALAVSPRVAVVLTKTDEVEASGERARIERDFDELVAHIGALFAARLGTIHTFKVAACPASDKVPRGRGVSELLDYWIEPLEAVPTEPVVATKTPSRFIARLSATGE